MKIIFNSDLLFANSLVRNRLPARLETFLHACKEFNHEVIIPETTELEFRRSQERFVNAEINSIKNAVTKLRDNNIHIDEFSTDNMISVANLVQLIKDTGVICELLCPTLEDFQNAHRRACLKNDPHPPDIKSDEMRDLVIWEIAIRTAESNGGAILMSRDEVHSHHRGDVEANNAKLIRCPHIERALESLSIDTEASRKIKSQLEEVWDIIIGSKIPIVQGGHVIAITQPVFKEAYNGITYAACKMKFQTGDGKVLSGNAELKSAGDKALSINLCKVVLTVLKGDNSKDENIEDIFYQEFTSPDTIENDYLKRYSKLKSIFKS